MGDKITPHEHGILLESDEAATLDISVLFGDEKGGLTIGLTTVREHMEVRITPSGLLRAYLARPAEDWHRRRLAAEVLGEAGK